MRRLARSLFTLLAAISAILFLAVSALWIRSCWAADSVSWTSDKKAVGVGTFAGGIIFATDKVTISDTHPDYPLLVEYQIGEPPRKDSGMVTPYGQPDWSWGPVQIWRFYPMYFGLAVRTWSIAFLLMIAPAIWIVGFTRRRRVKHGHCPTCGYDLRASPERCPECGVAAPKPSMSTQAP